jgi:peptidoglycan/xylan/chitin deacetylase (PgdA/CDA1 family)
MKTCSMSPLIKYPLSTKLVASGHPFRVLKGLGRAVLAATCLQVLAFTTASADPVIVQTAISSTTARDGQTVTLRYRIQSSAARQAWLGAELQAPNGVRADDPTHEHLANNQINISAGTNWYERQFFINLPADANYGAYRVTWELHWGTSGFHSLSQANALQILEPVPVDAAILMYHKVGDTAHSQYWVTAAQLEQHIRALKQAGYTFVRLQDVMDYRAGIKPAPSKPVVLTFDDGYEDLLTKVLPVISKSDLRVPITSFMNPGLMGQTNTWDQGIDFQKEPAVRHLTWAQARTLHNSGLVDFQSHTMTHINLLTEPHLREQELRGSRAAIESELGKTVRFFAHPFGAGADNATIQRELREAGYFAATGTNKVPETRARAKFALRRHDIHWNVTATLDPSRPENYLFGPALLNDRDVYQPDAGDFHPADTNRDWILSINEVTAYGSTWRSGGAPLSYVTRAGYLWRRGGSYQYDSNRGSKPEAWIER